MSNDNDRIILNSIFNPLLPLQATFSFEELPSDIEDGTESDEIKEVKYIEIEGVKAAEAGELNKATELFSKAIQLAPRRASGYNNRAQAFRLKGADEDALVDLNKAIVLSDGKGRSGCQALCQRGLIYRKKGHNDLAKEDFEVAARYGSEFAKSQLIQLNPYAALCNTMLHSVMLNLQMPQKI